MARRDRTLKAAFDRHRGVDRIKEKQRKHEKQIQKRKQRRQQLGNGGPYLMSGGLGPQPELEPEQAEEEELIENQSTPNVVEAKEEDIWETEDDEENVGTEDDEAEANTIDLTRLADTESSSDDDEDEDENAQRKPEPPAANGYPNGTNNTNKNDAADDDEDEEEEDEDVPLSDIASIASDERGDIVPHQRLTINNTTALLASLKRIALPLSSLSFSAHQSVTTAEPVSISDINDDLTREQAFYAQSLSAVKAARQLLKAEGVPFGRPPDYFAEMVKSDEHMGRVRQKLVDAAASKKAAQEARRQRDLKKFGKKVQVEKLQERAKQKRDTLERINSLKRKRANAPLTSETEPDIFDIELQNDDEDPRRKRADGGPAFPSSKRQKVGLNPKRAAKDAKYGFGGKKRHLKSGDAFSSADMSSHPGRKMKGKGKPVKSKMRPGKSKRAKARL